MRVEPACDLILSSWNHLEETRPCLESLFRNTDVPARLWIVDTAELIQRAKTRSFRSLSAQEKRFYSDLLD